MHGDRNSGFLSLLITFLTIFGGIATIVACAIAFLALVNPRQTESVIVQLVSGESPTARVVTVAVTATPPPGTATRTPEPSATPRPSSTPEPTATRTPIPTATPLATTVPGTVLEPGQKWYGDGLVLLLEDHVIIEPRKLRVYIKLQNITDQQILFEMQRESYRMIPNPGETIFTSAGFVDEARTGGLSIQPGEVLELGYPPFDYNFANEFVKSVIIEVEIGARLEKAQWLIEIPH